jgi:hypothetical protein
VDRRQRPVGLEIEFLDDTSSPVGGAGAEWLSASPREPIERRQRALMSPAGKWIVGLGLAATATGGLLWLRQQRLDNLSVAPPTTVAQLPLTVVPLPSGGEANSAAVTNNVDGRSLELVALNIDSALLASTEGRTYRFDLDSFTLLTGGVAEPSPQRTVALWPGEGYLGDAADGTPVVRGTDGLAYLLAPDGRKTLLAEGRVDRVEFGWFAETVCIAADDCQLALHGAGGSVPYPAHQDSRIAFSPNGEHVAIWSGTSLELIDLLPASALDPLADSGDVVATYELGPETPVEIPARLQTFVQTPSGSTAAQPMVWRSDSTSVGFVDDNSLVLIDAISGKTERIPLPESAADPRTPVGG